jgi:protein-L-isoaspartate(D-aspartate) O-methyltransferase
VEALMEDFTLARQRMVDNQLRTSNITDRRILGAMNEVARETFVPPSRRSLAYADMTQPLGHGRSLAEPAPFAKLVQLAGIGATDTVLDVGAGTGYGTAVLARLGAQVTALEAVPELAAEARANLASLPNADVVEGPLGEAVGGPYDVIVIEGAVDEAPSAFFAALKDGGRLVALVRGSGPAVAHLYVRSGSDVTTRAEFNTTLPPLPAPPRDAFVFLVLETDRPATGVAGPPRRCRANVKSR